MTCRQRNAKAAPRPPFQNSGVAHKLSFGRCVPLHHAGARESLAQAQERVQTSPPEGRGGGRVSGSPLKIFGLQRDHELRVYLEKRRSRACWLETHARRAEQSLGHACLWITSAPKGAASARGGARPAGFTVRPSPGAEQSGARSPGLGLHCARRLSCLPGKATAWDSRVPSTCCKDPARQCSPPRRS